jgi:hypothetical protein
LSPFATSSARTIIWPATKPSGVNRSGTWLRFRIELTRKSFTLFFGAEWT